MPMSAPRPCRSPGCVALARSGYCDKHKPREQRKSARARGYDSIWDRVSKRYRKAHPLCERHKANGKTVAAMLVDHIVPVHIAPERIHDESNLQSLCQACHSDKTLEDQAKYGSASTHSVAALR